MVSRAFLIDTQVFIWWMEKSNQISQDQYTLLNNPQSQIFLSVASVWEIILKKEKKKLKLPYQIEKGILASGFQLLSIELAHILRVEKLPMHHKDPFDRLLISQAKTEDLTFITSDQKIWEYDLSFVKV